MIRFASRIIPTPPLTLQDTSSIPIPQMPRSYHTKEDETANLPASIRKGTSSAIAPQTDHSSRVPGLKFGFTGNQVAITFGPNTIDTTLIEYRIDGQDWQLTNVSTGATHLLVSSNTTSVNLNYLITPSTFEMRVTNWAYGVQISAVHVGQGEKLVKVADFPRTLELIGDSLTAGMYASLEGLSSFGYGLGAGLGNTEYSVTAYLGVCLFDKLCWGNPHGMLYQWFRTSDTSWRASQLYGDNPEWWDLSKKPAADIVVINLGTNDNNSATKVTADGYEAQYKMLVEGVHKVYPSAQIILMVKYPTFSRYVFDLSRLSGKASAISATHTNNPR
jgi:hypothetical protein